MTHLPHICCCCCFFLLLTEKKLKSADFVDFTVLEIHTTPNSLECYQIVFPRNWANAHRILLKKISPTSYYLETISTLREENYSKRSFFGLGTQFQYKLIFIFILQKILINPIFIHKMWNYVYMFNIYRMASTFLCIRSMCVCEHTVSSCYVIETCWDYYQSRCKSASHLMHYSVCF